MALLLLVLLIDQQVASRPSALFCFHCQIRRCWIQRKCGVVPISTQDGSTLAAMSPLSLLSENGLCTVQREPGEIGWPLLQKVRSPWIALLKKVRSPWISHVLKVGKPWTSHLWKMRADLETSISSMKSWSNFGWKKIIRRFVQFKIPVDH